MEDKLLDAPEKLKIYVIIVSYNGIRWIEKCLQSVFNSNYPLYPIVIDNASTDGTAEYIMNIFPTVRLIETGKNIGFGQANNKGLQVAYEENADYVLLLNQDAWLERDTIDLLITEQQKHPEFWILSPIQKNSIQNKIENQFNNYLLKNHIDLLQKSVQEVDFACAAIWLMTKQCIETVGGFDPLFPHYGEDNDYVRRLHYWGSKVGVVPRAIGFHDREFYDSIDTEKQINRTTLSIIGLLKDISNPLSYLLLIEFSNLLIKTVKYCIKLDITSLRIYNKAFVNSLRKLKQIREHRKTSSIKGAYLKLEKDR